MFRTLIVAMLLSLLFSCSDDDDIPTTIPPPPSQSKISPAFPQDDGATKIGVASSFTINVNDDLSALPPNTELVQLRAVQYSPSSGYNPNDAHHPSFENVMSCVDCHMYKPGSAELLEKIGIKIWSNMTIALSQVISGTATITDNTIIFKPDVALDYATQYELSIQPVVDTNGNTISAANYRFKTYENPKINVFNHDQKTGEISNYSRWLRSASVDNLLYFVAYNDPGNDFEWSTLDDTVANYSKDILSISGQLQRTIIYSSAGPDNVWFNAEDNEVAFYIDYEFNTQALFSRYIIYDAGSDKTMESGDDVIYQYTDLHYDDNKTLIATLNFNGPGTNNVWLDEDDTLIGRYTKKEQISTTLLRQVTYSAMGVDQKWYTEDDEISAYVEYKLNDDGVIQSRTRYNGAGLSGDWFDGDDSVNNYIIYSYNASGLFEVQTWYNNDNSVFKGLIYGYDSLGRITSIKNFSKTTTNIISNREFYYESSKLLQYTINTSYQNQVVTSVRKEDFIYDEITGNRLSSTVFNGGLDNDLSTTDDNLTSRFIEYEITK